MVQVTTRKSQDVIPSSDMLELEEGVFKQDSPKRIAESLKTSAEHSSERESKIDPYWAAMSTLSFYIKRAGSQLPPDEKKKLEKAKDELKNLYSRPASGRTTAQGRRVEKPGECKLGGPSGQTDMGQHDKKHANK